MRDPSNYQLQVWCLFVGTKRSGAEKVTAKVWEATNKGRKVRTEAGQRPD